MSTKTGNAGDNIIDTVLGDGVTYVDGLGGTDTLNLDWSKSTTGLSGYWYNALNSGQGGLSGGNSINWTNIERLNARFGSGNDSFYLYNSDLAATLDGGAGTDYLYANFAQSTTSIRFTLNQAAAAVSTFEGIGASVASFERFDIYTGTGNDQITTGDATDTVNAGAGTNSVSTGGGNDSVTSTGIDTVDMGAGTSDSWTGNYQSATTALNLTQSGTTYRLSNGGTVTGAESISLNTGSAADSFGLKSGGIANVYLNTGTGTDTVNLDWSTSTATLSGSAYGAASGGQGSISGDGSVGWYGVETLNARFGSGNDTFYLYNTDGGVTLDMGAGDDSVTSGSGNDAITGGIGRDTVTFSGRYADYRVTTTNGVTTVADLRTGTTTTGTDTLRQVERAQFSDQTINIAVNTAPRVVGPNMFAGTEDNPVTLTQTQMLANDSDVDGDAIVVAAVRTISGGTPALNPDGTVTFTPTRDFNGIASFAYTVDDGNGGTAEGIATIRFAAVNDAPVATDDGSYTAVGGQPFTVGGNGVLANDLDIDSGTLQAVLVSGPAHGALALNANGSFTYTAAAGYLGADSFTYRASDGTLTSNLATVALNVVNQSPTISAGSPSATLREAGVGVTGVASATVQLTRSDPDGTVPDYDLSGWTRIGTTTAYTQRVQYGTVTLDTATDRLGYALDNASGATNALRAGQTVTDAIVLTVSDGYTPASTIATFSVVGSNDAPIAIDDGGYTAIGGQDLTVAAANGILANDGDVDSNTLSAVLVSGPEHGTLTLTSDGSFRYTAAAGYLGSDSFTYRASDGTATSNVATVALTVGNQSPTLTVGQPSATLVEAGAAGAGVATSVVQLTTVDPDGTVPTYDLTGWTQMGTTTYAKIGTYGGATLDTAANTIRFLLDNSLAATNALAVDESVFDRFPISVTDGFTTISETIAFAVRGSNDGPVARADTASAVAGTPISIAVADLLANDSDVEGDILQLLSVTNGTGGTATLADGIITFTPTADFFGVADFSYALSDGLVTSTATVSVTVSATQSPPPLLSVAALTPLLNEGDRGDTAFTFQVVRSGDLSAPSSVSYAVAGELVSAADFTLGTLPSGSVVFAAGESAQTITVLVRGDRTIEGDEQFTVTLSDADGSSIDPLAGTATATIYADDGSGNYFYAGAGNDLLSFAGRTTAVQVAGNAGIDHVIGGSGNDSLNGGIGADRLEGGAGNDSIVGGRGADLVVGGTGNDIFIIKAGDLVQDRSAPLDIFADFGGIGKLYGSADKDLFRLSGFGKETQIIFEGSYDGDPTHQLYQVIDPTDADRGGWLVLYAATNETLSKRDYGFY